MYSSKILIELKNILYIPIFVELSKDVENAGLLSKFANDWDVWVGDGIWLGKSSLKNSNLFGVISMAGVGLLIFLGFWKQIHK